MNKNFVINHLKKHHSNLKIVDKNSVFNNNYIVKFSIPRNSSNDTKVEFDNVSQAFAYLKAHYFNRPDLYDNILNYQNVKKTGLALKSLNNSQWLNDRFKIMLIASFYKYQNNPELKEALLKLNFDIPVFTGHNKYWTCGIINDVGAINLWCGQNQLGSVLLKIRSMLLPKNTSDSQIF